MTTFTTEDREVACSVTVNVEPIPFAGMVQLQEPQYTKKDADEAFFNLGKLMGRIPLDEAKRLEMMVRIICSYVGQLEGKQ
jgi:hypothetical protein